MGHLQSPPPRDSRTSLLARHRWRRELEKAHYATLRLILARSQFATANDAMVTRLATPAQRSALGSSNGRLMRLQGRIAAARAKHEHAYRHHRQLETQSGVDVPARLRALETEIRTLAELRDDLMHKLAYAVASGHYRSRHLLGDFACSHRAVVKVTERSCYG